MFKETQKTKNTDQHRSVPYWLPAPSLLEAGRESKYHRKP